MKKPIYICANVIVRRGDTVLLTLRDKVRFASGYYSIISGGVKEGESIKEAAVRELYEEVGILVKHDDLRFYTLIHSQEREGIHMSTFFVLEKWEGELVNREPEKHSELAFYPLDALPGKLVPYVAQGLRGLMPHHTASYYQEYRWDAPVPPL